jgi:maltose/moltooligosaccharide transporter
MSILKKMPYWRLLLMNFGFFGIQHGFNIQFAKMSVIYEKLGANPEQIPVLWLAAPLTGMLIQPLVGYFSDRTWLGVFGRRRPYFCVGAILAAIALFFMPNAGDIWMAAGLLWILDASINVSMQPFRAFVADHLPSEQLADGYSMQTLMIGLGGTLSFWIASQDWLRMFPALKAVAPSALHIQFYLCGLIYLLAVLVTVFTTGENPPPPQSKEEQKTSKTASQGWLSETWDAVVKMPAAMRELAVIQVFTWFGLFCMWIFYSIAIAHSIFGATNPHSPLYDEGVAVASQSLAVYPLVSTAFALILPFFTRKLGNVHVYTGGLLLAALGLLSISQIHDPNLLWLPMVGVGIGWAIILSMPYTILVDHLPESRYGLYMGIFNLFVVFPEILSSVGLGWMMKNVFNNDHMMVITIGGVCMLIAAALTLRLHRFSKLSPAQKTEEKALAA